jgi:hypothetical protein
MALFTADARGQMNLPFGPAVYEHDFQLFAPVELDLDNQPYVDDCGYFAQYDKLWWSYNGENYTVGDPNVMVTAERIYLLRPQDEINNAPPGSPQREILENSYPIQNGLTNVTPDAGFAWGNRYELGYRDRGNGWLLGVLDGPELNQTQVHGIGENTPFIDRDYTDDQDQQVPPPGTSAETAGFVRAFGFGSVHVNFATPPGYLFGFRDYLNFLAEATLGTQGGPILYVGNYASLQEDDFDDLDDITITFFRIADDIDGDLIPGAGFVVDADGNAILQFTDFDDLHEFNVAFDQVTLRNSTETDGIEAMWTHELTNRHYQAKHQNNQLQVAAGARFFKLYDEFSFEGLGGILGRTFFVTSMDNQIVGPQVAARWVNQRQRWRLTADARFMFGYNVQDWKQFSGIGEELIPGALNRPLFAQPTYTSHGLQQEDFSPVGELRVDAAYYLTQSVALKFGYTGMFAGNIRRAATSVLYSLPEMGYREAGTQDLIVNGFNFGVEFIH